MALFVGIFWPVVGLTAFALGIIGIAGLQQPELRQRPRFQTVVKFVAVLLIIELVLIPVWFFALIEDMPNWW